jgi:NTE family protein
MEDLWLPMFAISSNFTQAKEEVHRRGSLWKNLLASIAIPGVFPPIISGNDLLVDGATFNNFPVDVMRNTGVKTMIGCDLVVDKKYQLKISQTPSTRQFFVDKLKPRKKRKYRLPSLTSILINATVLYSYSKRRQNAQMLDLLFNPDLSRYGMTNWKAYDKIVETGYAHAIELLSSLPEEKLQQLQQGIGKREMTNVLV